MSGGAVAATSDDGASASAAAWDCPVVAGHADAPCPSCVPDWSPALGVAGTASDVSSSGLLSFGVGIDEACESEELDCELDCAGLSSTGGVASRESTRSGGGVVAAGEATCAGRVCPVGDTMPGGRPRNRESGTESEGAVAPAGV